MLLAEANQWPADVVEYFGPDGDECHMCVPLPADAPDVHGRPHGDAHADRRDPGRRPRRLPDGCQWGIFLRNHDELTLEMVTDEERDYMYREYAKDPRMKRNVGISRRLFPLLENDRRVAELFHGLLLSLPGSPILYYGDEIGMGDNIYLGDRDGVRTPMQWTPGPQRRVLHRGLRPALPAAADGPRLRLPVGQRRGPGARPLLVPALVALDARGAPHAARSSAWARSRRSSRPTRRCSPTCARARTSTATATTTSILCVNNLSRLAQPVELDLSRWDGYVPIEMLGGVRFPRIGELPYFVTLHPYAFYWFKLVRD